MNQYLVKVAASKEQKNKDSLGIAGKGLIAFGSAQGASAVASPFIRKIGKSTLRDMENTGVTASDVKSYQKANGLRHVPRSEGAGYYTPGFLHKFKDFAHEVETKGKKYTGTVHATNDAIAMHEYGHARTARQYGKAKALRNGAVMASVLSKTSIGKLALAATATSKDDKVSKGAVAASAALSLPLLHEEAAASIHPYKHLKKTRGADVAKKFGSAAGKAYGTYLLGAAATVGGTMLARTLSQKARAKKDKENAALKHL